jgi:hypothetical protein
MKRQLASHFLYIIVSLLVACCTPIFALLLVLNDDLGSRTSVPFPRPGSDRAAWDGPEP